MDQRFQQTLNFNFNNVPVRFNLSSNQPLPENFVVNTVRSLVRNASSAIGLNGEGNQNGAPNSVSEPLLPSASISDQPSQVPNSTTIPMWNQHQLVTSASSEQQELGHSSSVPSQSTNDIEQQSHPNGDSIPNPPPAAARGPNTSELVSNLMPHIINVSRVLVVLFGKHLSGYFLDLLLCVGLIFSFMKADEAVKRLAYSEQLLSWRNLRSVLNNLFLVSSGLLITAWLYSSSEIFWLFAFYVNPEGWAFGNFITTATTVVMANYFIKCSIVLLKLCMCMATRCTTQCLPMMPNLLSCLDVFGHLYLCSVIVCFWFVYIMRDDGNFTVGLAIFVVYFVSRVPYFWGLLKDCFYVTHKLASCRTHGRRASPKEVEDSQGCAICLQDGFRQPTVVSCNHVFCHSCISRWLLDHGSCPVCRHNLMSGNETRFQGGQGVFFM